MIYWATPLKGDVNWREKWVLWTLINIGNAIRPLLLVCNGPLLIQPAPSPEKRYLAGSEMSRMEVCATKVCEKCSSCLLFSLWCAWRLFYLPKKSGGKKAGTLKKTSILCDSSAVIVKDIHTMMCCPTQKMFFKEWLWGLKETPNTMLALCAFLAWAEP